MGDAGHRRHAGDFAGAGLAVDQGRVDARHHVDRRRQGVDDTCKNKRAVEKVALQFQPTYYARKIRNYFNYRSIRAVAINGVVLSFSTACKDLISMIGCNSLVAR